MCTGRAAGSKHLHDLRCRFNLRSGDHRRSAAAIDRPSAGCLGDRPDKLISENEFFLALFDEFDPPRFGLSPFRLPDSYPRTCSRHVRHTGDACVKPLVVSMHATLFERSRLDLRHVTSARRARWRMRHSGGSSSPLARPDTPPAPSVTRQGLTCADDTRPAALVGYSKSTQGSDCGPRAMVGRIAAWTATYPTYGVRPQSL